MLVVRACAIGGARATGPCKCIARRTSNAARRCASVQYAGARRHTNESPGPPHFVRLAQLHYQLFQGIAHESAASCRASAAAAELFMLHSVRRALSVGALIDAVSL